MVSTDQTINCLIVDDEPTAREILEGYVSQMADLKCVQSCANALEAFKALEQQSIDLVLLDINMPDISGISLARAIGVKAKVVFTTAYREYAVEGFDLQAVDYLLKPISFQRFVQAVDKFRKETLPAPVNHSNKAITSPFLLLRADRKTLKIPLEEIHYIESLGDYLKVHTEKETIITREAISSIEKRLDEQLFLRIHRSFIVALNAVTAFTKEDIELGEHLLPISRSYKDKVSQVLRGND